LALSTPGRSVIRASSHSDSEAQRVPSFVPSFVFVRYRPFTSAALCSRCDGFAAEREHNRRNHIGAALHTDDASSAPSD
jgi:hypothetical protein